METSVEPDVNAEGEAGPAASGSSVSNPNNEWKGESNEVAQNIKSNSDNKNGDKNISAKKGTQLVKDSSNRAAYVPYKKKLDVIVEAVDGLTIEHYFRIIADKIGWSNIKYASRLCGGRVCVYLSDESYVKELSTEGGITVNGFIFLKIVST
jgi:hypothetical protein